MSLSAKHKAKLKFDKCVQELERVLRFDEPDIKKRLEIVSQRSLEEYKYSLRLISSANYYLNIYYSDFLYLLYSKTLDLYKIGKTKNMDQRVRGIEKDMGLDDIEIIYEIPNHSYLETTLHKKFSHLNVPVRKKQNHREWFKYDDEIINEFEMLKNG
jgi:hypothetical protein